MQLYEVGGEKGQVNSPFPAQSVLGKTPLAFVKNVETTAQQCFNIYDQKHQTTRKKTATIGSNFQYGQDIWGLSNA